MPTKIIDVHEAQPQLAELLSLVVSGTDVVLTDGTTPVARLVALTAPNSPRIAGLHAGLGTETDWMSDDFDEPLPDEFWTGESNDR